MMAVSRRLGHVPHPFAQRSDPLRRERAEGRLLFWFCRRELRPCFRFPSAASSSAGRGARIRNRFHCRL